MVAKIAPGDGDSRHGTLNGYTNLRCRCASCRAAGASYGYRTKLKRSLKGPDDPRHGTENGYGNFNCRCRACTDVWSAAAADRARRRAARQAQT